jgi:hypothetical protein
LKRFAVSVLVILAVGFASGAARAEAPAVLAWQDLVPPGPPVADPTRGLAPELRIELGLIATTRAKLKRGTIAQASAEAEWARGLERKFTDQGLDLEGLLERRQAMQAEIERQGGAVNAALDGKLVKIPGYVLPLELDGTRVGEFLLVPFVGACIHVPAPPKNQMVFVRLKQSYAAKELYEPVWVTGRLKAAGATKSLSLVDGSADIETGYTLDGMRIEPYKE